MNDLDRSRRYAAQGGRGNPSLLAHALMWAADPGLDVRVIDHRLNRRGTVVALPDGDPHGEVTVQWDRSFHVTGIKLGSFKPPRYEVTSRRRGGRT